MVRARTLDPAWATSVSGQAGGSATAHGARPRDEASRRFGVNVGSSLLFLVLNTGLMVWYIPFLVGHLGVAVYGVIPLTNAVIMFSAVVSDSLNVSIYRHLAIDLNQGDAAAARRTFNSALALTLLASAVMLVPFAFLTTFFTALLAVPAGMEAASRFLFGGSCALALGSLLGGAFGASSLITHRFDLRNLIRSVVLLARLGIVAACFAVWPASLWHVAAGLYTSALIALAGDVLTWRRLTPQLRIEPRAVDRALFRPLLGFGGWSAVNTVGFMLLMQVDLIIANALLGAEATGRYGAMLVFPVLVYALVDAVVPILNPAFMARYAVADRDGLRTLAKRSVRLLALGLALPVGLLCGLGAPLLSLWLGPAFADLELVVVLLVGHLTVNLATRPLSYVLAAHDKVRLQGSVTLAIGAANVALTVVLALWTGWGVAGIAAAGMAAWTARNALFIAVYAARTLGLRWWAFYPALAAGALALFAVAASGRIIAAAWWPGDWLRLGLAASSICAVYAAVAYAVVLDRHDRRLIWRLLPGRLDG